MKSALILPLVIALAACAKEPVQVDAPLQGVEDAYVAATEVQLEEREPQEWDDLHNVYRLSDSIISGGEPHGEEALKRISEMGVKTILSVDGKVPDQETAAKYGMRYVHVPIHYSGISEDELMRITKAFRELEGPFFVHCFHGKHRGPAGAAVGRMVLDGASRSQALAEMRQWCGTAAHYPGLYEVIATGEIPEPKVSESYDWDFPAAHSLSDFREVMVDSARTWDNLKLLYANEWKPLPEHPDLDAVNESEKIAQQMTQCAGMDSVKEKPQDFRGWMDGSAASSKALAENLRKLADGDAAALDAANGAYRKLAKDCKSCHGVYRNN
jgi:protein tyrosine phosphatase (PTP) superfamily phosphohydrolase (DUF442 family)